MIKAQELRIGNWVLLGKNYQPVYQILYDIGKGHSINHMDYEEELFQPIPLTTGILEKCGFKFFKDSNPVAVKYVSNYYLKTEKIQISFIYGMTIINANSKNSVEAQIILDYKIEYLHQLQNLYFALTNSELEINLNQ